MTENLIMEKRVRRKVIFFSGSTAVECIMMKSHNARSSFCLVQFNFLPFIYTSLLTC
jgi:hypothetical protein